MITVPCSIWLVVALSSPFFDATGVGVADDVGGAGVNEAAMGRPSLLSPETLLDRFRDETRRLSGLPALGGSSSEPFRASKLGLTPL